MSTGCVRYGDRREKMWTDLEKFDNLVCNCHDPDNCNHEAHCAARKTGGGVLALVREYSHEDTNRDARYAGS